MFIIETVYRPLTYQLNFGQKWIFNDLPLISSKFNNYALESYWVQSIVSDIMVQRAYEMQELGSFLQSL